jgi:hypothetical protein
MTPNEQNKSQNLNPNTVWGKYPCDPEMMNRVVPIIITAVRFCNAFSSETLEQKAEKLCLWVEAQHEERALEGFCTLEDLQAHGLALGIVCRYRDTVIEPLAL